MVCTLGKILEPNCIGLHKLEYVKFPHYILQIRGDLLREMVAGEPIYVNVVIRLPCILHIV